MLKLVPAILGLVFSVAPLGILYSLSPSSQAADLQTIRRRGRLIVAVKDNLRPLGFRGADGQLQGLEIDLARQLAQELLGSPDAVEFRPLLNRDRFSAVMQDQVDIAIANAALTPSRLRIVSFSLPYYTSGIALMTNQSQIRTLADLKPSSANQKPVAVLNGSIAIDAVRAQMPGVALVGMDSYEAARQALDLGKVRAIAADAAVLSGWVQESRRYRLLVPWLSSNLVSVVLPKGEQYADLKQQIDQSISRLRNNGWLEKRTTYWGLPFTP